MQIKMGAPIAGVCVCFVYKQRDLGQVLTLKLCKTTRSEQVSHYSPETMISLVFVNADTVSFFAIGSQFLSAI